MWQWELFRQACGTGRYVVTDPDVVPAQDCPADWLATWAGCWIFTPAGRRRGWACARTISRRITATRDQVVAWESQFARSQVNPGIFGAPVDTTLALYHPLSDWDRFTLAALRTGEPYPADHLAWHENLDDLDPELAWYHEHAEPGIPFWVPGGPGVAPLGASADVRL